MASTSHAALVLSATRIVHEGDQRSTSVMIRNPSQHTYAAQTWVNTAADDTTTAVPFMPSPGLFRLDPGKDQLVRINSLPHTLPDDRESLFFFNLQEIPQAKPGDDTSNVLSIALRTRIKLFHRPKALKGEPQKRIGELAWQWLPATGEVRVTNPTPYHFTFRQVLTAQGERLQPGMVEPFADLRLRLPEGASAPLHVRFSTINDYGGTGELHTASVTTEQ
ncbi:fimbrial biogenesis chaperone [Pseudomonas sp. KNUC1026]|uniref:fimbrial biogenesis chaperone n=1 Tax=Pseudomonas sp. KNUC1026 TaxID=2893890 RepID=UPI001F37B356|nr:molecular chaperone [Pseudomonas sp. KNUC1026]UFH48288.1 molecular chaperone [Pseudomonas sp. KNUC1026]